MVCIEILIASAQRAVLILNPFCYTIILCNLKVIEIYGDRIRVSQRFGDCQMLEYMTQS